MMTRRQAITTAALALAAGASGQAAEITTVKTKESATRPAPVAAGPFTLPELPYAVDALEPHFDAKTMEIHHGKHHAAYVANLNKAVASQPELGRKDIVELIKGLDKVPETSRVAIRNHGGGHLNHSLFWTQFAKEPQVHARGELNIAIEQRYNSFDGFKKAFVEVATLWFGSGWVWMVVDKSKRLRIEGLPNQDSPYSKGFVPIMAIDLWEHAYYLKYQNRRVEYIDAFFKVLDWGVVRERYDAALKSL
jgi:Fe-Mn family superoxide dismutase